MNSSHALESAPPPSTSVRYARPPIDAQGTDSLAVLARMVEPASEVLDLGTSTGALGRHLSARGCQTDGVELDASAAAAARPAYRLLLEADLETADVCALFAGRQYDVVVCADVLEHLRHPGRLLEQARQLLKPTGVLLVSVPNVGYAGVVLELMAGEFNYRPLGILDATHLRFFTRASLVRLLTDHGFHPDRVDTVALSLNDSEFASRLGERVAPRVLKAVAEQPDALVYQYVVRARQEPGPRQLTVAPSVPFVCLGAQLFWHAEGAAYDEQHSVRTSAPLDSDVHTLRFALPASLGAAPSLRLDPSDRPGFLLLHSLLYVDAAGVRRWGWQAGEGAPPVRLLHQLLAVPGGAVPTYLSIGEDPSLELVLPEGLRPEGGTLEVRLSVLPTPEGLLARGFTEATRQLAEARAEGQKALAEAEARLLAQAVVAGERQQTAFLAALAALREDVASSRVAVEARQLEVLAQLARVEQRLNASVSRRAARLLRRAARASWQPLRKALGPPRS